MIFSIVIVILLVFLFFWAVQCHKQSEYEYYSNNQLSSMSKIISGLKPPTKEDKEAINALQEKREENMRKDLDNYLTNVGGEGDEKEKPIRKESYF